MQDIKVKLDDFYVFGELGLDGFLKDTKSIFVLILSLARQGKIKNILIPKESIEKVSLIPNLNIYAVSTLDEAIEFFHSKDKSLYKVSSKSYKYDYLTINNTKYYFAKDYKFDFIDIKGQRLAKKAALISAAGNHNIIMEGSPGCGKSMIAKRLKYIMPPMQLEEILDIAMLESMEGKQPDFTPVRTFCSPHHSGTKASIAGGTTIGEIALANHGILSF